MALIHLNIFFPMSSLFRERDGRGGGLELRLSLGFTHVCLVTFFLIDCTWFRGVFLWEGYFLFSYHLIFF